MEISLKIIGLDRVNNLVERAAKQVSELRATSHAINMALAEIGIEIDQPTEDVAD